MSTLNPNPAAGAGQQQQPSELQQLRDQHAILESMYAARGERITRLTAALAMLVAVCKGMDDEGTDDRSQRELYRHALADADAALYP